MIQKVIALILLVLSLPCFIFIYILIKIDDQGELIFKQKRTGKNRKPFILFKFRTMVLGAEKKRKDLQKLNEANGPVFKMRNDPRYTKIGKFLAHTGLDELPQLVNIIKGEMAFIGPRPLPLYEDKNIPKKYEARYKVLPGITSPWVVGGSHNLPFSKWMQLDVEYAKNKNIVRDLQISFQTLFMIGRLFVRELLKRLKRL
jgi:lipopolysaccharide/colanic/teichoic acid biosynthesis glycosyltransferase